MLLDVGSQAALLCEARLAQRALERLLSSVNANVADELHNKSGDSVEIVCVQQTLL